QRLQSEGEGPNGVVKAFPARRQSPERQPTNKADDITDQQPAHGDDGSLNKSAIGGHRFEILRNLLRSRQQDRRPDFRAKSPFPESDQDREEKNGEEESFHVAVAASDWAPLLRAWVIRLA